MGINDTQAAWLAGLFDGEGSIGITKDGARVRVAVQMSMTCKTTIDTVVALLAQMGVTGLGYSYREKKSHHKDAHYLRVNRVSDVVLLGARLLPYSVTKRQQWEKALAFCRSRLVGVGVDDTGRIKRGGRKLRPYSAQELALVEDLRVLNRRGRVDVNAAA